MQLELHACYAGGRWFKSNQIERFVAQSGRATKCFNESLSSQFSIIWDVSFGSYFYFQLSISDQSKIQNLKSKINLANARRTTFWNRRVKTLVGSSPAVSPNKLEVRRGEMVNAPGSERTVCFSTPCRQNFSFNLSFAFPFNHFFSKRILSCHPLGWFFVNNPQIVQFFAILQHFSLSKRVAWN